MSAHTEWLYAPEVSTVVVKGSEIVNGEEVCHLPGTIGLYLSTDDATIITGTPAELISLLQKAIVSIIKFDIRHPELHRD